MTVIRTMGSVCHLYGRHCDAKWSWQSVLAGQPQVSHLFPSTANIVHVIGSLTRHRLSSARVNN